MDVAKVVVVVAVGTDTLASIVVPGGLHWLILESLKSICRVHVATRGENVAIVALVVTRDTHIATK